MKEYASWGAVVSAAFSALIGLYGAVFVRVRDNIDVMMQDVAAQSRFAIATALLAALSVLLQGLERLLH